MTAAWFGRMVLALGAAAAGERETVWEELWRKSGWAGERASWVHSIRLLPMIFATGGVLGSRVMARSASERRAKLYLG